MDGFLGILHSIRTVVFIAILMYPVSQFCQQNASELNFTKRLGKVKATDGLRSPMTIIQFDQGLLSVQPICQMKDNMYLINDNSLCVKPISVKPIFVALGLEKTDDLYLSCITSIHDTLIVVDLVGIAKFKIDHGEWKLLQKAKWPVKQTPREVTVHRNKIFVSSYIYQSPIYRIWEFDLASLEYLGEKNIGDEQALYGWCAPNRRSMPCNDSTMIFSDCTNYLIKRYSLNTNGIDTIVKICWPDSVVNAYAAHEDEKRIKSNCQWIFDNKLIHIAGTQMFGRDTMCVFLKRGGKLWQRDQFLQVENGWQFLNSREAIFTSNDAQFDEESYIRTYWYPDFQGYYWKGQLFFCFTGPPVLPKGGRRDLFEKKEYGYMKKKIAYCYLSSWRVKS